MKEELNNKESQISDNAVHQEIIDFCHWIKQQRENNNINVEQFSRLSKIRLTTIKQLESGQWDKLAGNAFIKGFVSNYIKILKLDEEQTFTQLKSCQKHIKTKKVKKSSVLNSPSHQEVTQSIKNNFVIGEQLDKSSKITNKPYFYIGLTALLVLASSAYFLSQYKTKNQKIQSLKKVEQNTNPELKTLKTIESIKQSKSLQAQSKPETALTSNLVATPKARNTLTLIPLKKASIILTKDNLNSYYKTLQTNISEDINFDKTLNISFTNSHNVRIKYKKKWYQLPPLTQKFNSFTFPKDLSFYIQK